MSGLKKIIIAAEIFPPDIGGPATYTVKLATELKNRGWEVLVVCYSDKPKKDNFNFFVKRIVRSKIKFFHYVKYYQFLKKISKDADIIYAMGPMGSGLPALIVAKTLRKRLAVKVVGDYAWESARNTGKTDLLLDNFQTKRFKGKVGILKKVQKYVCSQANRVIVPSQYLKKIVGGWGVPDNQISVVYNSFEKPDGLVKKITDKNLIISIGRLVPWKGFDVLIELVKELLLVNPEFKLKIFGSGPEEQKLRSKISALGLGDKVTITSLDRAELMDLSSEAGLFVLNTGYEGLSHTILEMMFLGVPIIATDIGGNPELIENNINGILVEYNNKDQIKEAILKIYSGEGLREKFVKNSHEKLKGFTFEKMIDDTKNILETL